MLEPNREHDAAKNYGLCSWFDGFEKQQEEIMTRKGRIPAKIVLALTACNLVVAQGPIATDLTIDVENVVEYRADISDITKFARNPGITPPIALGLLPTQT